MTSSSETAVLGAYVESILKTTQEVKFSNQVLLTGNISLVIDNAKYNILLNEKFARSPDGSTLIHSRVTENQESFLQQAASLDDIYQVDETLTESLSDPLIVKPENGHVSEDASQQLLNLSTTEKRLESSEISTLKPTEASADLKKLICQLHVEQPSLPKEKIAELFQEQTGVSVETSTVEDILKNKDQILVERDSSENSKVGHTLFKCVICNNSFRLLSLLKRHLLTHSEEKPAVCETCKKCFRTKSALRRHMIVHTSERSFLCTQCGKSFRALFELKSHEKVHADMGEMKESGKLFLCFLCGRAFKRSTEWKVHMRTHSLRKSYTCHICKAGFRLWSQLKRHQQSHSTETPYLCTVCNKKFKTKAYLKDHLPVHDEACNFSCPDCGKAYRRACTLREHKALYCPQRKNKSLRCWRCNMSFHDKDDFMDHMMIHPDITIHQCKDCDQVFPNIGSLKRHTYEHEQTTSMQCDICKVFYSSKLSLKRHIQQQHMKDNQAEIKCDECGKKFTAISSLKDHKRLHRGERPYKCDLCSMAFTKRWNLKKHQAVHFKRGERPKPLEPLRSGKTSVENMPRLYAEEPEGNDSYVTSWTGGGGEANQEEIVIEEQVDSVQPLLTDSRLTIDSETEAIVLSDNVMEQLITIPRENLEGKEVVEEDVEGASVYDVVQTAEQQEVSGEKLIIVEIKNEQGETVHYQIPESALQT